MTIKTKAALLNGPNDIELVERELVCDEDEVIVQSLGEPIACAMYSGLHSGVQLGDTIVVMGGGFAGQIIAQVGKKKGAA